MKLRPFGRTGMEVSEVGFGAWAIGGKSYGSVSRKDVHEALARAEELGCNFVDTAAVYGDSEAVLGEFLKGRQDRWRVATKYSGQDGGLIRTAEEQLRRLGVNVIDFYQLHWVPLEKGRSHYDDLFLLKERGLARAVGVSLYTVEDIDFVLGRSSFDGIQVILNLLEPAPLLLRLDQLSAAGLAVVVRSSLKGGLLTGRYTPETRFSDPNDQRSKMERRDLIRVLKMVDRFGFLSDETGSLAVAAARYPLSFSGVSTVILGTKSAFQARENFGVVPEGTLSPESLQRIKSIQARLRLGKRSLMSKALHGTKRALKKALSKE